MENKDQTFEAIRSIVRNAKIIRDPIHAQQTRDQLSAYMYWLGEKLAIAEDAYEQADYEYDKYFDQEVIRITDTEQVSNAEAKHRASVDPFTLNLKQKVITTKTEARGYKYLWHAIDKKLDSLASAIRLAEKEQIHSKN